MLFGVYLHILWFIIHSAYFECLYVPSSVLGIGDKNTSKNKTNKNSCSHGLTFFSCGQRSNTHTHTHIKQNPCAVYPKLTQHCKPTILQEKNKAPQAVPWIMSQGWVPGLVQGKALPLASFHYGWKSILLWTEGTPRPPPAAEEGGV